MKNNNNRKNEREILERLAKSNLEVNPNFKSVKNKLGEILKQKLFSGEIDLSFAQELAVYITKKFQPSMTKEKIKEELIKLNQLFPKLNIQLSDFFYE